MPAAETIERTFEGFYADLDLVRRLDGTRRIVKRFRRPGIAVPEAHALARLRRHTPAHIAVPSVIETAEDTLVLTYIDGEPAGVAATSHPDAVAEQIIDLMTHWHAQTADAFEDLEGIEHSDFGSAYAADIARLSAWLATAERFDETVRRGILDLAAAIPDALAPISEEPAVFIHDDAHAGNFLVAGDRLAGVIDPGRARFTHRELDVFHLADAAPTLDLLPRYVAREPLTPGWERRRLLFSIWDDVKHARDAHWRDDAWFARKLDACASAH